MRLSSRSPVPSRSPGRGRDKPLPPTPIQRLPVELLEPIFLAALPPGQSQKHYQQVDTLSLVCRQWNTVVKSTPSIWSTLNIRFPPYRNLVALERSIGQPLEIHGMPLDEDKENDKGDEDEEEDEYQNWEEKIDILWEQSLPHAQRWEKVHWELPSVDPFYELCDSTTTAPLLEEATFMVHDLEEPPSLRLDFFGGRAPHLNAFSTNLPVPWSSGIFTNLTKLKLTDQNKEDLTIAAFIRLLAQCPHIAELELNGENTFAHDDPHDGPATPPIALPNLKRLVLDGHICCVCNALESIQVMRDLDCYQTCVLEAVRDPWYSNGEKMARWWKSSSAPLFHPKVARLLVYEPDEIKSIACMGYCAPKPGTDNMDEENLVSRAILTAEGGGGLPIRSFYNMLEGLGSAAPNLSIMGQGERTLDVVDRLSTLPTVDELNIGRDQPISLFLQRVSLPLLGVPYSKDWGFPALQSLIFIDTVVNQEKLLAMVETRWGAQTSRGVQMNKPKPLLLLEMREPKEELQPDIRRKLKMILGKGVLVWPRLHLIE